MRTFNKITLVFSAILFSATLSAADGNLFSNECFSTNPEGIPLSCRGGDDSGWKNNSCRIRCMHDQTAVCNSPILTNNGTICGSLTPASCYCIQSNN